MNFDTNAYTKILESDYIRFIDSTPSATTPTWVLVGAVETGNAAMEYNADIERLKLIVNKNAITNHKSNDKQMSVPLLAYKGDACFTFVEAGRDKLNYKTRVLEVDLWNSSNSSYAAKMSNATIVITNYNGDQIEFDLNFDGDPTEGSVTISGSSVSFQPTASL